MRARAFRIVVFLIIVGLLALFMRRIDWRELGAALASAKLWPLVISSAIYFANLYGKALTWRIMLAPEHVISSRRLFRYTIAVVSCAGTPSQRLSAHTR